MVETSRLPTEKGGDAVTIPVQQETLHVDTRVIDAGKGVRVHKAIVEHPCRIDELLTHDEIMVTHVPMDRIFALDQSPVARYEGTTLIVPVLEEVAVVEKRLHLKEEIHIEKRRVAELHQESVSLKSEEVSIERFDENQAPPRP